MSNGKLVALRSADCSLAWHLGQCGTMNRLVIALLLCGVLALLPPRAWAQAVPVELRHSEQGWQLWRDDEPYFIRGAGGAGSLQQLAAAGANSVRTWGADDIDALLDEAHALGMTVTLGIWLGHERHGFDYGDPAQVEAQLERARQVCCATGTIRLCCCGASATRWKDSRTATNRGSGPR